MKSSANCNTCELKDAKYYCPQCKQTGKNPAREFLEARDPILSAVGENDSDR